MPAKIRCPECSERFESSNRRRFRCPFCDFAFALADEEDYDAPRSRRRRDDDDEEHEAPGLWARPLTWVFVGLGVSMMLLIVVGAVVARSFLKNPQQANDEEFVAVANVGKVEADRGKVAVNRVVPAPSPAPQPPPMPVAPRTTGTPKSSPPLPARPPRAFPASQPVQESTVPWDVSVDPSLYTLDMPAKAPKINVPIPQGNDLLFPSSPSPFFAVGENVLTSHTRGLIDSRTGKAVGALGNVRTHNPVVLSPDGRYIAAVSDLSPRTVTVWSFSNGQPVQTFREEKSGQSIHWMDFGSENELLIHAGEFSKPAIQCWNISTGQKTRESLISRDVRHETFALSPGRRYLAFASNKLISILRLTDGKLVGTLPLPEFASEDKTYAPASMDCSALAFRPDGTELTGLFGHNFRGENAAKLATWKIDSGKLLYEHDMTGSLNPVQQYGIHRVRTLDYLPDGKSILVQGTFLIEPSSGAMLAKLQGDGRSNLQAIRVMPNDVIVTVARQVRGGYAAVGAPFGRPAYETALKAAQESTHASTADPVTLVPPDRTSLAHVAFRTDASWQATADGSLGKRAPVNSVPLPGQSTVRAVLFASPASGRLAVLRFKEIAKPFLRQILAWERFDISSGKSLGTTDLGPMKGMNTKTEVVTDVSPAGKRLVVRSLLDPTRLDVWDEDGKRLCAFQPVAGGSKVEWLGFVAEERVLVLSDQRLTLWDVPTCKAMYETAAEIQGKPCLSPGRKWLAVPSRAGLAMLDASTGECRGLVPVGDLSLANAAAAFTPDGTRLALTHRQDSKLAVTICNTADGRVEESFASQDRSVEATVALQWCGPRHLLRNNSFLLDLDLKEGVWNYTTSSSDIASTDGRVWRIQNYRDRGSVLFATTLPDANVSSLLLTIRSPTATRAIGPGSAISIQLNASGTDPDRFLRSKDALQRHLESRGFVVRDGAPLTLSVSVSEADSGEQMQSIFGSVNGRRTFNLKKLTATATLSDGSSVAWEQKQTFSQGGYIGIRTFRGDDDPEKVMASELWGRSASWLTGLDLPPLGYRVEGRWIFLPGHSGIEQR